MGSGVVRTAASRMADLLWPPSSLLSDARVDRLGTLESDLWQALDFLYGPVCARCGIPLPEATHAQAECAACAARPAHFDRARAALAYDDLSRPMVLALKHGGRKDGLRAFATWMREAAPFAGDADVVVPVPLHWTRLARRGFNQSAWLARALAGQLALPVEHGLLVRTSRTASQNGLSATARRANVAEAFAVRRPIPGTRVLLVDDVHTTGATLDACAQALKAAGAGGVDAVTLARVVRPAEPG